MKEFKDYQTKWNLSGADLILKTPRGHIYKTQYKNQDVVLKIFTPEGQKDESISSEVLKYFNGEGAVKLLQDDSEAHLLSYIDGESLLEWIQLDRDNESTDVICAVVKRLHERRGPRPSNLISLSQNFRALFEAAKLQSADPLLRDGAQIAQALLQSEQEMVVLHGDIHHGNILHSSSTGWMAIDPKALYGEKTYDFANSFYNPRAMPELTDKPERVRMMARKFSASSGIKPLRVLQFAFAYGCFSAAWFVEDQESPSSVLQTASIIKSVLSQDADAQ